MADEGTTGDTTTEQHEWQEPEEMLDAARVELDTTADELEQLTAELNERTEQAARLELITDALLDVMSSAAVVVDAERRVVAVSRAAAADHPGLADGLGRAASSVLPEILVQALTAFEARSVRGEGGHHDTDNDGPVRSLLALPDGSVLLLLSTTSGI